jgi:inner membrane protein
MPSILSHPAVPLGLAFVLGRERVSPRLLVAGLAASVLPDLDVVAFRLGVPYLSPFGHRGFTHSAGFALLLALAAALFAPVLRSPRRWCLGFVFVAAFSHPLLDAFTNGGRGVALLWPFTTVRFFAPVRPIQVAPLSPRAFFGPWGWRVLLSELLWVWLPVAFGVGAVAAWRKLRCKSSFGACP